MSRGSQAQMWGEDKSRKKGVRSQAVVGRLSGMVEVGQELGIERGRFWGDDD